MSVAMTFEPAVEMLDMAAYALFIDVDGTLLEIAETPQAVEVIPELPAILRSLSSKTAGALALVSGRRIADLDALFAPLVLPCAGIHGFERRNANGELHRCAPPNPTSLQTAREALQRLASLHEGLLVEDKGLALALHYRRAPGLAEVVLPAMHEIAGGLKPDLALQLGRMVAEFRPAACDKGTAVEAFLAQAPFRGRCPIYIGDDLTDEPAFERVNAEGGISIAVSVHRPTAAQAALPDVASVLAWLQGLPYSLIDLDAWTEVTLGTNDPLRRGET